MQIISLQFRSTLIDRELAFFLNLDSSLVLFCMQIRYIKCYFWGPFLSHKKKETNGESPVWWLANSTHNWKVVGTNLIQC